VVVGGIGWGKIERGCNCFIYLSRKWVNLAEKDSGYAVSAAGRVSELSGRALLIHDVCR